MIAEPDIDMPLRMPWQTICRIAVQACVRNIDMNSLMVQVLSEEAEREKRKAALEQYVAEHPELTIEQLADLAEANGFSASITLEKKR